ncbi:DsbA family protein [Aquibacillus sp. 3ASR75-11]|uniref:DsbA family protein n=1 Tax=Terrihalobacillus insolitus TaxID=2950438 RepID=A0A9X4AN52_9BACI|nr:DsbA family protein [Terrihalobacillus insolitus]MDC3424195.1 DsbA family protein [Terrihalobacillus insolitus]
MEVEWKAFELRPEGVELPPKPPGYMEQAKANVARMSEQYGIEMKWNEQSKHSRHALEGAKFAEQHGLGNEYHDAMFRAHFQQDKAINDIDTLVEIAGKIGLDQASFRDALETRRYQQRVIEDTEEAQQIGVTGIPCYIAGNKGVMGAQTYESLVQLIEEA